MTKSDGMLEEVIVERPPIVIKGDTVEFAASAFKQSQMLKQRTFKKIPGVEWIRMEKLPRRGKSVQKVYVDGKRILW